VVLTSLLEINADSVGKLANSFSVENASRYLSLGSRCAPTLKLANAFGVDENLLTKTRTYELATQRAQRLQVKQSRKRLLR
jgi:hypothetical protein